MVATIHRNVGTGSQPKGWLHERGVALIYDELRFISEGKKGHVPRPVRVRLSPNGDLSTDLLEGVASIHIPTEWDSVGGITPDLILKSEDGTPVRIIEVVVTSPPSREKRRKLRMLADRGVDCVEVRISTEADLRNLCWTPSEFKFADFNPHMLMRRSGRAVGLKQRNGDTYQGEFKPTLWASREADDQILQFMDSLQRASPATRRRFVELFKSLQSLESVLPVHPLNPMRDKLSE